MILNGNNLLIKNLEMNLKIQNLKLELLNPELITLLVSIKEKFIFSEDTEEWDTKELHLTIFIISILKPMNGLNLIILKDLYPVLEEDTLLLC